MLINTVIKSVNYLFDKAEKWVSAEEGGLTDAAKAISAHKYPWLITTLIFAAGATLYLGGALIKNGVIFGLLMTASLTILLYHFQGKKRDKILKWLAKHRRKVDVTLFVGCAAATATLGVTTGIAASVLALSTSLLLLTIKLMVDGEVDESLSA